ncbi:MAG: hypothetical protein MUC77_09660 [Chromatiaceae bacterium]|jgi:hypothetical protein|nr:hypothetical protein [Chromatiaceae bacterium]
MDKPKSSLQHIVSSFPEEASWDEICFAVVEEFQRASSRSVMGSTRRIAASLPGDASWDDIWTLVVVKTQPDRSQVSVKSDTSSLRNGYNQITQDSGPEGRGGCFLNEESAGVATRENDLHNDAPKGPSDRHAPLSGESPDVLARKGKNRKIAAFAVLALGLTLPAFLEDYIGKITPVHKLLAQLYVAVILGLTFILHRSGRFYTQKAREHDTKDTRSPVLYLRSFKYDESAAEFKAPGFTEEEQLVEILKIIGPVVALDNPVRHEQFPGARRIASAHTEWQQKVQTLIANARAVVVVLADSPSVRWELQQVRARAQPEQLLLIVPSAKSISYSQMKSALEQDLVIAMPVIDSRTSILKTLLRILTRGRRFQDYFSFQGFVYFDSSWHGHYAQPELTFNSMLRSPLMKPGLASMAYALRSFFNHLDVAWSRPRINPVAAGVFLIFAWGVIWGVLDRLVR